MYSCCLCSLSQLARRTAIGGGVSNRAPARPGRSTHSAHVRSAQTDVLGHMRIHKHNVLHVYVLSPECIPRSPSLMTLNSYIHVFVSTLTLQCVYLICHIVLYVSSHIRTVYNYHHTCATIRSSTVSRGFQQQRGAV